jgi:hypothetical protein
VHARLVAGLAVLVLCAPSINAQAPAQQSPQLTVGGVVYGQYLYQLKDSLGAGNQNQFSIQRAYVNAIGRFSGGLQTRVTLDIAPTGTGNQQVRLKYAYFGWTPNNSKLTYKLGLIHTPYVDWAEALWDYRMQGPIALDRNGYLTSSDFGAGVDGHWNGEQVNAQLAFVNGEGYSGGTGDNHKDIEARVSVRLSNTNDNSRVGGLRLTGYAGIGKPTSGGTRNRFLGTLSYKTQQFTLAAEVTATKDTITGPTPAPLAETSGLVISGFGVYKFKNSKAAVIGRVDVLDPNTDAGNNKQTRVIGGLSYQLTPNLRLLGDVDLLSYEAGATPVQDAQAKRALFQVQITF